MPVVTSRGSQHVQKPEVSVNRLGPDLVRIVKLRPQHHDITVNDFEARAILAGLQEVLTEVPAGSVPALEA